MANHALDTINIRGNNSEEVRGLLRLLPENTFQFVKDFQNGLPLCKEKDCGQISIYAKKESLLGERGVMLVVVNEHLFGDPTNSDDNPVLRVPDGATDVHVIPPRQPPLRKNYPFAGTEFSYRGANFFFGYELSEGAHSAIVRSIKNKD